MTPNEEHALNKIIELEGDCCNSHRCLRCPIFSICTSKMMKDYTLPYTDTKKLRVRIALDILTDNIIIGNS